METFLIASVLVALLVWLVIRWLNRESASDDEDLQAEDDVASEFDDPPRKVASAPAVSSSSTRPDARIASADELQVPEAEELSDEQAQALLARLHEDALQGLHRSTAESEEQKQKELREAQAKEEAERLANELELERQRNAAALKAKEAQEQEQQLRLERERIEQEQQLAREIARQEAAEKEQRAREQAALEEAQRQAEEAERRRALERAESERLERERLERERAAQALAEAAALQAAQVRREAEEAARREAAEKAAREAAAAEAAAIEAARQEALRAKSSEPIAQNRSPDQIVVMVADDSKVVRVKASRLLAKHQYQVVLAEDGTDAVQQMAQRIPDVLITDVEMPEMDGFELTRRVRSDPRTAHIHIIMITGADDKHRQAADEAGVNVLLGKPYEDGDLITGIERGLNLVS